MISETLQYESYIAQQPCRTKDRQKFEPIKCRKRWLHLCKDIKHNDGDMKMKNIVSNVYVKKQSR